MFYNNFINLVVDAMQGRKTEFDQVLKEVAVLKLYKYFGPNVSDRRKEFEKMLLGPGIRGFVFEDEGVIWIAANDAFFWDGRFDGQYSLVSFDDTDSVGRQVLNMAQLIHIKRFLSHRWRPSLILDEEFLGTLNVGSSENPRTFRIELFDRDLTASWKPPTGVTVVKREGSFITITIQRASKILELDRDLTIKSFGY